MHIKPYVVLGLATLSAGAGLGIVVATTDPAVAEPLMMGLFWSSLGLTVWGAVTTVCSLAKLHLAPALAIGLVWVLGMMSLVQLTRHGGMTKWLSGSIILATIVLSTILWIRSKKSS